MEGFRHKAGILAAIFCLIVILAVIWFCMSGGLRQKTPEGTLVMAEKVLCDARAGGCQKCCCRAQMAAWQEMEWQEIKWQEEAV